jgi:hypothetical protein
MLSRWYSDWPISKLITQHRRCLNSMVSAFMEQHSFMSEEQHSMFFVALALHNNQSKCSSRINEQVFILKNRK